MSKSGDGWKADSGLVDEVSEQFSRTIDSYRAHPALITEHANHEESIRTGGYASRTLLELVQNAADALSDGDDDDAPSGGRVEIVLDTINRTLYCANAGRPFSKDGFTAITMAHLSSKRGDEIGRFGLGFKSVLAVSGAPQVFSRSVSFEFNSAASQRALNELAPSVKRYPILRTATVIDAQGAFKKDSLLAELATWATTIVKLPEIANIDAIREDIERFSSEFLLFVHAVREVKLRIVGQEPFETSHISRDLGDGRLRIERPNGNDDEWFVVDRMHKPSARARKEVGEAVSRERVKVTVALPMTQANLKIGEFWSYFPLQDRTSASALFNAPWSVNDDRTTLLKNDYNREILRTLSEMFVEALPSVRTVEDPAAHLDYMPARGRDREILSFGDELLIAHIPGLVAKEGLIPNPSGNLCKGEDLRPLDFAVTFGPEIHRAWIESANTGDDVPAWRCYSTPTRTARLRSMFTAAYTEEQGVGGTRDEKRALEHMPKRGLQTWLREWAEGDDAISSENALKVAAKVRNLEGAEDAKVILTTDGMRSLSDRDVVFLREDPDISIDGAVFVLPTLLERPGVEALLHNAGFRNLDPEAILNARLAQLTGQDTDAVLTKLWDAALDVATPVAYRLMRSYKDKVRVPTADGGWSSPHSVFDVTYPLGPTFESRTLDRTRCLPDLAHQLGVISGPVKELRVEFEPSLDEYERWVIDHLNGQRGPGERPTTRIELLPGVGPGPFSMVLMLAHAEAPLEVRAEWTMGLLELGDREWVCEDLDTGRTYGVDSPVLWAAKLAGMLRTDRGLRRPGDVVAPSLVRYQGLLPLFKGGGQVVEALQLPDELGAIPAHVLIEGLEAELFPSSLSDETLAEFIMAACEVAYAGGRPPSIPARVRRAVEGRAPTSVYLAISDEQEEFLSTRQRPYLRVDEARATALVQAAGCRRFEESFAFSMQVEGQQSSDRILDVFTGMRSCRGAEKLESATITRAGLLAKRVTTEDGVEDQSLAWYLNGIDLLVGPDADESELLGFINQAFDLRLDNAELTAARKRGLDHRLEAQRMEAIAAESDAARLEVYLGEDDLREALPTGLWRALEAQGLVDKKTSVAELFLTVWGSDSIKQLSENFRQIGFTDVPKEWAGGAATVAWLRSMGFGTEFAGRRNIRQEEVFVVPGAIHLNPLHEFQEKIREELKEVITSVGKGGRRKKAMVELPTGAGKTRVASETVLRLFINGELKGPVLWIAQSQELCEQAVQTWSTVWRGLGDERPLTVCRLWENNVVHEPDTEFSVVVATDAKLNVIQDDLEYAWLSEATLVIIDEGHRAGGSTMYTRLLEWLRIGGTKWERPLVGLSATPFKGTSEAATLALANRFGGHIIRAFEGNAYQELVDTGVLARVKHDVLPGVKVNLTALEAAEVNKMRRINAAVLERIGRDHARMAILIDHIMSQDPSWPILVFTPNVLSAQVLAASLRYRGVTANSVSGQTGRQERRDVIDRFKAGQIQVLANCDLLIQGFDAPGVRALYIARPTFSPNAYIQMAGRGLRGPENGGKEECLIVDMADDFGDMSKFLGYREYEPLWREQNV